MSGFDLIGATAVGYLLGGFPSAALAARAQGRRIFDVGSGNMGAMNTTRNLGVGWGLLVLASDIGKGALAAWLGLAMGAAIGSGPDAALALALSAGVSAVLGHAWSPYVAFRGGKALATAFGVTLPVAPWAGLAGLVLIVALVLLLRRATLATMLTMVAYPLVSYLATMRATQDQPLAFAVATAAALVALIVALKHVSLWLAARRARTGHG